ncbi:MAG: ATP-binding protein [Spirochaetales bacterium]|nr:ATP-binding protein [Spirochaetales bacterium]
MHRDFGDYVLDVVQNAVEAGARNIGLRIVEADGRVEVLVGDDGRGMDRDEISRALDPFHTDGTKHSKRKVGLGLPFMVQAVEAAGGTWGVESEKGKGTTVRFGFPLDHPDAPPVGDLPGLVLSLMAFEGGYELEVSRTRDLPGKSRLEWSACRSELAEAAGGLRDAESLALAKAFLESQEAG